jgi:predicted anti-sigma-YlaC factor YlaD
MEASPNQMFCKELVELVTDYLEGALSPADHRRFELHLNECEGCQLYIDQIRLTIKAVGLLTEDSIEDSIGLAAKEELLAAFRDWKKG